MIDVIQTIKYVAVANGMQPILAKDLNELSILVNQMDITDGSPILYIRDDGFTPVQESNQFNGEINNKVGLFLCRKFEADTMSSISETYQQKYTARIFPLKQKMWEFLNSAEWCTGLVQLTLNGDVVPVRDFLAANLDGVSCDLIINTWAQ
jgi:hypothetical protein